MNWFTFFNGISTLMGYLMPKSSLWKNRRDTILPIPGEDKGAHTFPKVLVQSKVKLVTIVEGYPKAPFSIATTLKYRGGHYSFPWIAPLYP